MHPRQRIELRADPSDAEPIVSGWATYAIGEGSFWTFTLDHDYPGVKPAPGWVLACPHGAWHVASVEGKILTCQKLEVV